MNVVKFGDVVKRVNINVDRFNTERLYYVGKGGSIEPNALEVYPKALIKGATIGFKFHFGFDPGHILFMSRCFDQHKAATATFAGVCSDSTYVVETKDETVLHQRYLQLVMQSDHFWDWCEKHKSGGVNYLINYSTLNTYEFPLPPLSEQKRLAEKLWAAYEVKQSYINMIAATDEMVKSQFIEMFGQTYISGETTLADYVNLKAGKSKKSELIKDLPEDASFPCYGGNGIRGYVDDYTHNGDYCIIGRQGAQCGNVQIAHGQFYATEHAVVVSPITEINCIWMFYALTHMNLNQYARGVAQPGLAVNQLEKLSFSVPSVEKQNAFALIAKQADKSKSALRNSIASIDKVIKSLINENL